MHYRHVSEIVLSLFCISGEALCLSLMSSKSSPQHKLTRAHLDFCRCNTSLQTCLYNRRCTTLLVCTCKITLRTALPSLPSEQRATLPITHKLQ